MGGFAVARALSSRGVRIVCYHGFSFGDEHAFRPKLFITPETFEKRLERLRRMKFEPLSLQNAVKRMQFGELSGRELVITIDDGFQSVKTIGWPLLRKHGFPATLYVTSYYTQHCNPIFRLALQYMAWRTTCKMLDLGEFDLPILREQQCIRIQPEIEEEALWRFIDFAECTLNESERLSLAARIGEQLGVDYLELRTSRRLSLLTDEEIIDLHRDGLDIQLHTHRHRLPSDPGGVVKEIMDNRRVLEPLTKQPLTHLCYPSGIWSKEHWPVLQNAGIESAVTCDPGINDEATPLLGLRRFLDGEDLSMLNFEAELSGFKDLVRRTLRRRSPGGAGAVQATY